MRLVFASSLNNGVNQVFPDFAFSRDNLSDESGGMQNKELQDDQ
jgi:hypothetical protein